MDRTPLSKERKRYCVTCQQQDSKILCFSLEKFLGAKDIRGTLQNPIGNVLDSLGPAVVARGFHVQSRAQRLPTLSSGGQTHGAAAPSWGPPGPPDHHTPRPGRILPFGPLRPPPAALLKLSAAALNPVCGFLLVRGSHGHSPTSQSPWWCSGTSGVCLTGDKPALGPDVHVQDSTEEGTSPSPKTREAAWEPPQP